MPQLLTTWNEKVLKIFFLISCAEYRQIWLNILIDNYHLATKLRNKDSLRDFLPLCNRFNFIWGFLKRWYFGLCWKKLEDTESQGTHLFDSTLHSHSTFAELMQITNTVALAKFVACYQYQRIICPPWSTFRLMNSLVPNGH